MLNIKKNFRYLNKHKLIIILLSKSKMAEVKFTYEGLDIIIRCNKNQKMKDICTYLSKKINVNINSLIFLYGGIQLNL